MRIMLLHLVLKRLQCQTNTVPTSLQDCSLTVTFTQASHPQQSLCYIAKRREAMLLHATAVPLHIVQGASWCPPAYANLLIPALCSSYLPPPPPCKVPG